ncbi:MAG: DUF3631 domain-containing protein [Pseudomonadota bacterium]
MDIFKAAILLKGYTEKHNPDRIYNTAKHPIVKGFTAPDYTSPTPKQIEAHIASGGWVGHLVPVGYHVIDVEDPVKIGMIRETLRRKGLSAPVNITNNGVQFVFSTNGGPALTADSGRPCRLGFEVTDRAGGKNYVILPPTNGRTWENEAAPIPTIPDELLPPENTIADTLKVLAWSLGDAHRKGILAGYDDIDAGFMALLVDCDIVEADVLEAYRLVFLNGFEERRTLDMYRRTKDRKEKGEPLTGTASLVQSLKDKDLKSIVASILKLERLAGKTAQPPMDDAIQRLAKLPPLQYDQVRRAEAKALGVRPATLDEIVKAARKGTDNTGLPFIEVESWETPVDPARLLSDIAQTIRRFIVCTEEIANAVALWVAMTWFIAVVQVAPLAVITAPEKRCGKTLLLNLLGQLSARSVTASNISPAALFRTIEKWAPTLLIDEADSFLKDNEELRGLLNSGHTRDSAYVIRTVGDSFTPTRFSTWAAKAIAGIGHVADTLQDRAIILELRRKTPDEVVERIRYAEPNLLRDLRSKLAKFAEDFSEQVRQARPPLPNSLHDRAQDNWEPLLAIAQVAGGDWLQIGTTTALRLSGIESLSQTIGVELLADIQSIFDEQRIDRISTVELISALCADDEKPWLTYNKGVPIKPRQLAGRLKNYSIKSKPTRIGTDVVKGYEKSQFIEAFSRYVPSPPEISVTELQPLTVLDLNVTDDELRNSCEKGKVTRETTPVLNCNRVTEKTPLPGANTYSLPAKTTLTEIRI